MPVKPDNAYFIPAGAIHAIGKGILIAEIQQTSDITYRVFDWNRVDKNGKGRELHTDLAADAINFSSRPTLRRHAQARNEQVGQPGRMPLFHYQCD